jgi:hypothetical protein
MAAALERLAAAVERGGVSTAAGEGASPGEGPSLAAALDGLYDD